MLVVLVIFSKGNTTVQSILLCQAVLNIFDFINRQPLYTWLPEKVIPKWYRCYCQKELI